MKQDRSNFTATIMDSDQLIANLETIGLQQVGL